MQPPFLRFLAPRRDGWCLADAIKDTIPREPNCCLLPPGLYKRFHAVAEVLQWYGLKIQPEIPPPDCQIFGSELAVLPDPEDKALNFKASTGLKSRKIA